MIKVTALVVALTGPALADTPKTPDVASPRAIQRAKDAGLLGSDTKLHLWDESSTDNGKTWIKGDDLSCKK